MRGILDRAEAAADRVLFRRDDCSQDDVVLARDVGLIEWDCEGPHPTDLYGDLLFSWSGFAGGKSNTACWIEVLVMQFGISREEAGYLFHGDYTPEPENLTGCRQ